MERTTLAGRRAMLIAASLMLLIGSVERFAVAVEGATPVGLRVFYTGHSFHMFVPPRIEQLVKSAGIEGHRLVGTQGIGGSRVIQHWDLASDKNKAKQALEKGDVDVFTMAAHVQIPDQGIENFAELGLKHNAKLRLLVQASWMAFDQIAPQQRVRENAERDNTKLDDLEAVTIAWRTKLETQVDDLNRKHGQQAVFIVPVGNAVNKLRERIVAGKFPGIAKQSELFRDPIGHGLGHVQLLTAYCNFAAIYRRSPEGLKIQENGVDDSQHAILQQIAWETVSSYSHSGVAKR